MIAELNFALIRVIHQDSLCKNLRFATAGREFTLFRFCPPIQDKHCHWVAPDTTDWLGGALQRLLLVGPAAGRRRPPPRCFPTCFVSPRLCPIGSALPLLPFSIEKLFRRILYLGKPFWRIRLPISLRVFISSGWMEPSPRGPVLRSKLAFSSRAFFKRTITSSALRCRA